MKQTAENYLSMCTTVVEFCDLNTTTIESIPALKTNYLVLKSHLAVLNGFQTIQATDIKGWAAKKGGLKSDMIEKAIKAVNGLTAFALSANDTVLFNEVNYTKSKLNALRDEEVNVVCTLIHTRGNERIAEITDFGVSSDDLNKLSEAIGLYEAVRQMPSEKEDERQFATKAIDETIGKIRQVFKIIDRIVRSLKISNTEFYEKYFNAREIYDIGVRHQPDEPTPTP